MSNLNRVFIKLICSLKREKRNKTVKMHMLSGGRLRMAKRTYYPDAARGQMFELPVSRVLLRHAQGNGLFDTGCHPDVALNPEARPGALAQHINPTMPAGDHVLN